MDDFLSTANRMVIAGGPAEWNDRAAVFRADRQSRRFNQWLMVVGGAIMRFTSTDAVCIYAHDRDGRRTAIRFRGEFVDVEVAVSLFCRIRDDGWERSRGYKGTKYERETFRRSYADGVAERMDMMRENRHPDVVERDRLKIALVRATFYDARTRTKRRVYPRGRYCLSDMIAAETGAAAGWAC